MTPGADRLSWPAVAAALVAFTALGRTVGGSPVLPLLGLALVAAGFSSLRLERGVRWLARIALFAVVAVLAAGRSAGPDVRGDTDGLINPQLMALFGELAAAELVLRAWRRYDAATAGERLFAAVGCSAVVFLAASNTFDGPHIRWLAPVYLFLIALSLRGYRRRADALPGPAGRARIPAAALRAGALLFALSLGGGAYAAFYVYRSELIEWGSRFIGERMWREATGMSSTPSLGPTFDLRGSPTRVLRVENYDGDGHLRGMSFDTYEGGRWGPSVPQRRYRSVTPGALRPNAPGSRARITRLREDRAGLLFAPLSTAGFRFAEEGETIRWARDEDGPLRVDAPPPFAYQVIATGGDGSAPSPTGLLAAPPDAEQRARCLVVPDDIDPRVRRLAREIAGGLRDPAERVRAVETYLLTNHAYSTSVYPGAGDPVSNFLLRRLNAHCEFFASAAVILLRGAGVPTRYVTGYLAHEEAGPNALVVRQRDAHAWAESWIDNVGWVIVEATPGNGRPDGFGEAVPFWQRITDAVEDALAAVRQTVASAGPEQVAGLFAAAGVAYGLWLLVAARLERRRRPASAPVPAYTPPDADLAALARRFEDWLRRRGLPCPAPRTWREHLAGIELPLPAREFVSAYEAARFGGENGTDISRLRDLLEELPSPPDPLSHAVGEGEERVSVSPSPTAWERGSGGEGQ